MSAILYLVMNGFFYILIFINIVGAKKLILMLLISTLRYSPSSSPSQVGKICLTTAQKSAWRWYKSLHRLFLYSEFINVPRIICLYSSYIFEIKDIERFIWVLKILKASSQWSTLSIIWLFIFFVNLCFNNTRERAIICHFILNLSHNLSNNDQNIISCQIAAFFCYIPPFEAEMKGGTFIEMELTFLNN